MDSVANDLTHILILDNWFSFVIIQNFVVIAHSEKQSELLVCGSAAGSLSACVEEAAM